MTMYLELTGRRSALARAQRGPYCTRRAGADGLPRALRGPRPRVGRVQCLDAAEGHTPAPILWQCYVAGPESGPDPATWRTELNRPLTLWGQALGYEVLGHASLPDACQPHAGDGAVRRR